MGKRMLWFLAVGMMTLGLALPAQAARQTGEIKVMLDFADGEVSSGQVTLHYVGTPAGDCYRLTDAFGGGLVKQEDSRSAALARWLAESGEGTGTLQLLDAEGTTGYTGLEPGLYLLVQKGQSKGLDPVPPVLIPMPWQGQWEVVALPQYQAVMTQVPETGQSTAVVFWAMALVLSGLGLLVCFDRRQRK